MNRKDMYIYLNEVKFYAYHGVAPQENIVGNMFTIDLKLKVDFSQAATSDKIEKTVSYADIYARLKEEMQIPSQLLECVCERILQRLFRDFPTIEAIDIKLSKQNPPMGADIKSAGVRMYCER